MNVTCREEFKAVEMKFLSSVKECSRSDEIKIEYSYKRQMTTKENVEIT
jgi:hypothetical protein